MFVEPGQQFTATLITPTGIGDLLLGARIEVPVTRAIVGYWRPAILKGLIWSVQLEAPPAAPLRPPEFGSDPALEIALAAGSFNIVWMDGESVPTIEIFVPLFVRTQFNDAWSQPDWPVPDVDLIAPTVEDVAILVRTRTYTEGVVEHADFTDDTRPPADEVQRLIDQATPTVLMQLRPTFPPSVYGDIGHLISLYTAILIEGSFFREQINESQVALYRDLFTTGLAGLNESIDNELLMAGGGALRLV